MADDLVQQLFDLHNQARQRNGIAPYTCLDSQLNQLSLDHVKYEISIDNINHNGFLERCRQVGNVLCGENTLYDYVGDAAKYTTSWMNSAGHRANILNSNFRHAGFAVQKGPSGKWFATAYFTSTNPRTGVCVNTTLQQTATPTPSTQAPQPTSGTSTPVPTLRATPAPTTTVASEVVKQLFQFHNEERVKNGVRPFSCLNTKLSALSTDYVNYVIRAGKMSHDGFSERCRQAGNNGACAENILFNYNGLARNTTTQWMRSTGARTIILSTAYDNVGFAVKKAPDGKFYATAMFTKDSRPCA
ncbi:hypothetical protein SPRG_20474 [Saprolegnia parasitica CBS 223.65]|uniref:SCP domain-containing protein n=1 Tax=Saprolegnia parasitica (strain CBS 223.65) TaxID=695850 RepID=A0A067CC07_SAPPC|nr:hypothetical protein SPRG_20474 [Saprolegnia parasitica CBS 223.65]KDO26670.1 hypothetical protein SPRG_20474 [Saprolegnia parasitica CBS 223.65]|eukprot:XP_012202568.1 hypothetical protein SPRG_20474 [Saprolegnia parasitica CBS 223.65]